MPADSHVVPCGEIMGSSNARDHEPIGSLAFCVATASEATNNRPAPTFRFIGISDGLRRLGADSNETGSGRTNESRVASLAPTVLGPSMYLGERVYSYRSATIGSTCVAFPRRNRASCPGNRQQQNGHASKCQRVVRTDSVEQTRQKTGQHKGAGNASTDADQSHLKPLTDNQLENVPAIRPERQAHRKFTSSLARGICHHAVDSDAVQTNRLPHNPRIRTEAVPPQCFTQESDVFLSLLALIGQKGPAHDGLNSQHRKESGRDAGYAYACRLACARQVCAARSTKCLDLLKRVVVVPPRREVGADDRGTPKGKMLAGPHQSRRVPVRQVPAKGPHQPR